MHVAQLATRHPSEWKSPRRKSAGNAPGPRSASPPARWVARACGPGRAGGTGRASASSSTGPPPRPVPARATPVPRGARSGPGASRRGRCPGASGRRTSQRPAAAVVGQASVPEVVAEEGCVASAARGGQPVASGAPRVVERTLSPGAQGGSGDSDASGHLGERRTAFERADRLSTGGVRVHLPMLTDPTDSAPGEIRTHTEWCLRPSPLPLGYRGRIAGETVRRLALRP